MKKLDWENKNIFSVLDANFARLSEGLRVLEDIARFILRDYEITKKLKEMRHSLLKESQPFDLQFLNSRGKDVGASLILADESKRENFVDLVLANAKRVEGALRVLEEYFKFLTPLESPLCQARKKLLGFQRKKNWLKFQQSRFLVYEIEKQIISKLLRQDKIKKIFPLYLILDAKYLNKNPIGILKQVIEGGVKVVQYRDKKNNKRKILKNAFKLKEICQNYNALFLINDYLDIALAVEADGVHLGEKDLPIKIARKILPFDKIIGSSVHNLNSAKKAEKEGADYLSLGAVYPSLTKEDVTLVKPSLIKEVKNKISLSVIAIGGINENNLKEVMRLGVDGVAIARAILADPNPKMAATRILSKWRKRA